MALRLRRNGTEALSYTSFRDGFRVPAGTHRVPYVYRLARLCRSGSQAPFSWLLATHCWMKYIPSTPSLTLG